MHWDIKILLAAVYYFNYFTYFTYLFTYFCLFRNLLYTVIAVVHACGGAAGFAACWMVGPRLGHFEKNGEIQSVPPHSVPVRKNALNILTCGYLSQKFYFTFTFSFIFIRVHIMRTASCAGR